MNYNWMFISNKITVVRFSCCNSRYFVHCLLSLYQTVQHHLRLQSEHSYSDLSHIISSGKHCFLFTYMVSWRYQHRFGELKCPGATLMVVLSIKKTCCVVLSMLMPFKTQPEEKHVYSTSNNYPMTVDCY